METPVHALLWLSLALSATCVSAVAAEDGKAPVQPLSDSVEERRQVPVGGNGLRYLEQGAILFNRRGAFELIGCCIAHTMQLSIVTRIGSSL